MVGFRSRGALSPDPPYGPQATGVREPLSPHANNPCTTMHRARTRPVDTPLASAPGVRTGNEVSLGERCTDRMRDMMGSWPCAFAIFAIMIVWAVVNSVMFEHVLHHKVFDPYPLFGSTPSSHAGRRAIRRLTDCRQTGRAISSEVAIHASQKTDDSKTLISENTELTAQIKRATDLLEEIHLHLVHIAQTVGAEMRHFPPGAPPSPAT
jgi:hypothetical protein